MASIHTSSAEFRKEEYQKAADILRNLVKSSADQDITEVLTAENASKALQDAGCDELVRMQIYLFMREGNIMRYISQNNPGICLIDYNRIVLSATERSGLDQRTVIALLNVILYAISVSTELRFSNRISSGKPSAIWAVTSRRDEETLRGIRDVLDKYTAEPDTEINISNHLADLNRLADAGIPDALYLKGKCYFEGIGTAKDPVAAYQYLDAACRGGSAEANAMLGDYYFYPSDTHLPDPTEAYERYTALGSVALSEQRQKNLKALMEERSLNYKFVVINFVAYIAMFVLNILVAQGMFSGGQSHWFWGTVSLIFLTAVFSLSVLLFIRKPYGDQHWAVPTFAVIALLLMLVAL